MIINLSKQELLNMLRKLTPDVVAAEILAVQPMDGASKAYTELYEFLKANPELSLTLEAKKQDAS